MTLFSQKKMHATAFFSVISNKPFSFLFSFSSFTFLFSVLSHFFYLLFLFSFLPFFIFPFFFFFCLFPPFFLPPSILDPLSCPFWPLLAPLVPRAPELNLGFLTLTTCLSIYKIISLEMLRSTQVPANIHKIRKSFLFLLSMLP